MINTSGSPVTNLGERRRARRSLIATQTVKDFSGGTAARQTGRGVESRAAVVGDYSSSDDAPGCFLVGCSDYRAAEAAIVAGEVAESENIFHDNIANLVVPTDINFLSVLQYAVEIRVVKNIVVAGHHNCAGVRAAIENRQFNVLSNWLRPIARLAEKHKFLLEQIADENDRLDALCELNVVEQVAALCRTTVLEKAWRDGRDLVAQGFVFDRAGALLTDFYFRCGAKDSAQTQYAAALKDFARRWKLRLESF